MTQKNQSLANSRSLEVWLFCAFIGLRVAFTYLFPITPSSDAQFYLGVASGIASGYGYLDQGHPSAFAPVGYPLILAAVFTVTGPNPAVGVALNLVASACIFWQMKFIGEAIGIPRLGILIALSIYTFYPNAIAYNSLLLTELVFTALLLGGHLALLRSRSAGGDWLAGAIFGICALVRTQGFLFPFGAILALFVTRRDWTLRRALKALSIVYITIATINAPWVTRNYLVFGEFIYSAAQGGIVLYAGNNPRARGVPEGPLTDPLFADELEKLAVPLSRRFADPVGFDRAIHAKAREWIRENPGRFLGLIPIKLFYTWGNDGEAAWEYERQYEQHRDIIKIARMVNFVVYFSILLPGIFALFVSYRGLIARDEQTLQLCHLYLYAALASALAAVYFGFPRYHFPAMPLLALAAGWTIYRLAPNRFPARSR